MSEPNTLNIPHGALTDYLTKFLSAQLMAKGVFLTRWNGYKIRRGNRHLQGEIFEQQMFLNLRFWEGAVRRAAQKKEE